MKKVAIDARYLSDRYLGSGFHSYLWNVLLWLIRDSKSTGSIVEIEWHLFSSVFGSDLMGEAKRAGVGDRFFFHCVGAASGNYLDDILESQRFKGLGVDLLFLPHICYPRRGELPVSLRVVVVVHDLIPTLFLKPRYLLRGRTPVKMVTSKGVSDYIRLKAFLPRVERIISISRTTRDSLLEIFPGRGLEKKVKIIPLGGWSFFPEAGSFGGEGEVFRRYGLEERNYFFYFGGHTARKNLGRFVRAFYNWKRSCGERGSGVKFVMIGEGYWKRWLKRRPVLCEDLIFLPKVKIKVLQVLIGGAIATVYPSLYEGFGLPFLESLQLGCPVLFSRIPASLEILAGLGELGGGGKRALLRYSFDPYSRMEMERALEQSIQISREVFSKFLPLDFRENSIFDWEKNAKATEILFRKILIEKGI